MSQMVPSSKGRCFTEGYSLPRTGGTHSRSSLGTNGEGIKHLVPLLLFWPLWRTSQLRAPVALTEASAATGSQLNFSCRVLTLSQVFLLTLLPIHLLRVNLHFIWPSEGRWTRSHALWHLFVTPFPRLGNYLFSQKTQRTMSEQAAGF